MSDIRKTFNFRTGVQVDDETFIVRGSQVGIGTTIPTEALDVRGNAKVVGVLTATNIDISAGISTFGDVKVGTGISISASSGVVTATKFVGDGSLLTSVPTSAWGQYSQTYNGATVTSISKDLGNVGVGTTNASSNLQVGANPYDLISIGVGIKSTGNARFSGIVTASQFVGDLTGGISNLIAGGISTFTDDVQLHGSVGVTSVTWDKSANSLIFNDGIKAAFGNSSDLQVYHSGDHGYFDNTTGNIHIRGDGGIIYLNATNSKESIVINPDAGVDLHYNTIKRFFTSNSGIGVSGITTTNDLNVTGVSTSGSFVGPLTGAVTGNVTGNLAGNVTSTLVTSTFANITGVSTFGSLVDINNRVDISAGLNVVGLSTFVEQVSATSVNVSGIVTASTFVGALTGNVTGNVTGNLTGNITGNTSGTAGGLTGTPDITVDDIIATKVGVNTATAAKQLHVYDDSNDVIRVNSNKDGAYVSFVDETGNWQPYVGGRGNDISLGNLNNGERVRITGIGSVGIGVTIPDRKLHVVGTSTITDTAYFGGVVNIRGDINAPDSTLNVNELSVESINAFNIGNKARMHSTVGITTLNKLYTTGIATFMGNVSVGTTSHDRPFVVNNTPTSRFSVSNGGFVGIGTNSSGLPSGVQLTVNRNAIIKRGIGIGDTTKLEALVDFSYVGTGFTGDFGIAYMLPPRSAQTAINAFTRVGGGTTQPGAIVFNVTTNKLQCYDGTQWRNLW